MKPIIKPSVMARFGIEYHNWSEYGHLTISFSVVNAANGYDTPNFDLYSFDRAKSLVGIDDLKISSQLSAQDIIEKGMVDSHYGYQLALSMKDPLLDCKLDDAIKAGKRIQKRVQALSENEGYPRNYADYLRYVFRAMNVKYITHESYSSQHFDSRWKGYKMADIDTIIERCTQELIDTLRWNVSSESCSDKAA